MSGGYLVVDDTQALGIIGSGPEAEAPYGAGGGGSLRWSQVDDPNIIMVSSLAKGFGVPVAILAGSRALVKHFEAKSETRVHTSPPSSVVFHAAERALAVNQARGDALRTRLAHLVHQFRKQLAARGLSTTGGLFPVQTLRLVPELDARLVYKRLLDLGVRSILLQPRCKRGVEISLLITALHRFADIERAVHAIEKAVRHARMHTRKRLEMHR